MKQFFQFAAAAAFLALSVPASATTVCLQGNCPSTSPAPTTSTQVQPRPTAWQSIVQFNSGWTATTDGLASGIGDNVNVTSDITEKYIMNSLGSVMVDPNCGPACGEQTLTSNWDLMQKVDNRSIVNSTGHGTANAPITARAGTMSMGSFEGFMGSLLKTGVPPLTSDDLPVPVGE